MKLYQSVVVSCHECPALCFEYGMIKAFCRRKGKNFKLKDEIPSFCPLKEVDNEFAEEFDKELVRMIKDE